jgi:hypothetical protein
MSARRSLMRSRLRFRLRIAIALLGVSAGVTSSLLLSCGSAKNTAAPTTTDDASIITVKTSGGGIPNTTNPAMPPANPFSRETVNDGGASDGPSSGGRSSSGGSSSSSSGGSSSGASSSVGSSSGQQFVYIGGAADASPDAPYSCDNYTAPMCGTMPCDLRSNTCCVDLNFNARCIPGANASCNSNEATGHCLQQCECPADTVCCGVENSLVGVVQTSCQSVPDGGHCQPYPQTSITASAQLCHFNAECKTAEDCITQTCIYNIVVQVCGLQSQAPFNCHQ